MKVKICLLWLVILFSATVFCKSEYPLVICKNDDGTWGMIAIYDRQLVVRLDDRAANFLQIQNFFAIRGKKTAYDDFESEVLQASTGFLYQELEVKRDVGQNSMVIEQYGIILDYGTRGKRKQKINEYKLYNCELKTLW